MYNAGIDIGSVTTKCVIVKGSEVAAKAIARTGTDSAASAAAVFSEALGSLGAAERDMENIVSTGYGRRRFSTANRIITEISAAGSGAWLLNGKKGCVAIDVGGQDTKVVMVADSGEVTDFLMNDKCAAGTGRFLEMMAHVLGTDLPGLSALASNSQNPISINATCSVFAESEVVSLIASAACKEDISAGIFKSIASRIAGMSRQFGHGNCFVFCGGGARSDGLKKALEKELSVTLRVLPDPQFTVAHGAALSACL